MTRLDDLQKRYPTIPKEVILKWDTLNRGIRDSADLDKTSEWVSKGGVGTYQTYDHDLTLKDVMEQRQERAKKGRMLRPTNFYTKSGMGAMIQLDTKSPYQIRETSPGQFGLFDGEEKVDLDIFFANKPQREDIFTSKGTPVSELVNMSRRCFFIVPVRYCEYFATGDQCKFCNFNLTQEDAKFVGINRPVTINLEETVEAYKMCGSDVKMIEGKLEMGGFMNSETEGRIFFDFVGRLANALPYKPSFGLITEAMSRKDYQRLKDAGLDVTSLQLEVWDQELFPEIVPGKAKHCSRERWLEAFQDAVDVFGVGHVSGKIIGGLTMIPENGHKTWQEARDSHIEGNTWMIKHGVFPTFTNLRLPPGAVYAEDPANRAKLPPTEYYLEVAKAHDEAMKEYGLYDKMSKFLYCGLCCTAAPYVGDIGIVERSGDVGTYMSDVVPEDANWMAKFVNSINSTVKPQ